MISIAAKNKSDMQIILLCSILSSHNLKQQMVILSVKLRALISSIFQATIFQMVILSVKLRASQGFPQVLCPRPSQFSICIIIMMDFSVRLPHAGTREVANAKQLHLAPLRQLANRALAVN